MDWSDFAESLKGAQHVTINIVENGEMFTGPVQVNQSAEPAPAAPAVDNTPRKADADRGFYRDVPTRDPDPAPVYVMPWQIMRNVPTDPEPEPVAQIAAPRKKTIFEVVADRYADQYAEIISNGVRHAAREQQWIDAMNQRQFAQRP